MIYEFALEPELVATWHDRKEFLFFDEKFGLRTRRIISAYPKKWRFLIWRAFSNSPHGQDQNAQTRLDALLNSLCQNIVKRRNSFPEKETWLEKTEAEHSERPFHGIVAIGNPRGNSHIIQSADLLANSHALWNVPDVTVVTRTTQELVAAVAPILRVCQQAVFIDPYFDPTEPRFIEPFKGFMDQIWNYHYGIKDPDVELHTKIKKKPQGGAPNTANDIVDELQRSLTHIIPAGKKIRVVIWKQRKHGEKLHNRYILTDIAGVSFGTGLDRTKDHKSVETDDLQLLSATLLDRRWKQYKGTPAAFDLARNPIEITGTV